MASGVEDDASSAVDVVTEGWLDKKSSGKEQHLSIGNLLDQLDGILFTGGSSAMPPAAARAVEYAFDENAQGRWFPLWGTCMVVVYEGLKRASVKDQQEE